jgi:hypothetical protein
MLLRIAVLGLGILPLRGMAQVPPGPPYDPDIHPNPVVTFVGTVDFADATWDSARESAGLELLGLSGDLITGDEIALAPGGTLEVRVLGRRTQVFSFPVVRQMFHLTGGGMLWLYSFRNPRTDLPSEDEQVMLNAEALAPPGGDAARRFGTIPLPEDTAVRDRPALLFTAGKTHSLFWQEGRVSHVAVADLDLEQLFFLVEDLL